jgi:hypothetical protein
MNDDDDVQKRVRRHFAETPPEQVIENVGSILRETEEMTEEKCGHVPARPDVDLTICWICGVEIIPDPDTHLWRPLTDAERLVKHEVIRQLHDLFFALPPAEFHCVLAERLVIGEAPAIRLAEDLLGRWIIVHGHYEDLAWSGSRWVPHRKGVPTGGVQISNFATREEAKAYAEKHFPREATAGPSL